MYRFLLDNAVLLFSLLNFAQDIQTCRTYSENSLGTFPSGLPFITQFFMGVMYVKYGSLLGDCYLFYIGMICMFLYFTLAMLFVMYDHRKNIFAFQLFMATMIFIASIGYMVVYGGTKKEKLQIAGRLAAISRLITLMAPVRILVNVVRLKSSCMLSFCPLLIKLVTAMSWASHGQKLGDPNVLVPSQIDMTLRLAVIITVWMYQPKYERLTFQDIKNKFLNMYNDVMKPQSSDVMRPKSTRVMKPKSRRF